MTHAAGAARIRLATTTTGIQITSSSRSAGSVSTAMRPMPKITAFVMCAAIAARGLKNLTR